MAENTATRKRATPKSRTTSSTTRRTPRRKPAARKAEKPDTATGSTNARPAGKLQSAARDVAHAHLGLAAQVLETVGIRVIQARVEAPKRWDDLVKRGERVRHDLEQAGESIRRDVLTRIAAFDPRAEIGTRIAKARTLLGTLGRRRAAA